METVPNKDLQLAFDFVRYTNRNIFLTGKAGTGKTTFLHDIKRLSPKRMIVVAPTGVAAINAGGVTIHSFFQLPFHPYIPSFYLPGNIRKNPQEQDDPAGYKMSREKVSIIRSLDLLIIDEISMVRADTLDAVDSALRRYKNRHLPFGGVQLLLIGDLQQLAPVVKEDDRELLKDYYDSYYFFGSRALRSTNYLTIELNHIYRQNDRDFISLLNSIRENNVTDEVLDKLNNRYIPDFDPDSGGGYITLTTHNNQARTINESKLQKLPGKAHSFSATVKDEFPELSYPNDSELVLKEGAQVMFVKNDISGNKLFFNGKIGKIVEFEEDAIIVKCPDDDLPISVEMVEWQNVKFTLDNETKEIEETVIGTFTQYPLRLAWAITIHKSQGLTFDRAVIDASAAFAHGQVYVALSRCRTINGLVLSSRIGYRSVIDNPVISGFIRESVQKQPGPAQLIESKKAYQQQLLSELFDFSGLHHRLSYCQKIVNEHSGSILGNPGQMLERTIAALNADITVVADRFQLQIRELLKDEADPALNGPLQERVKKGAVFFAGKTEELLKDIISGYSVESDNKLIRRSVNEAFARAGKECREKLECLNAAREGFDTAKYLRARAMSAVEIPAARTRSSGKSDDISGEILHPDLFEALRDWRSKKAAEKSVSHFQVMHQKTLLQMANTLPQSAEALRLIKGIGRKKAKLYGEELLEIISSYCEMENIAVPEQLPVVKETPKTKKPDTKVISLGLYKQGLSITEIAGERKFNIRTIEEHLAHFIATGEISVSEFVSEEITSLITGCLEGVDDLKMSPVKEVLGDRVSWSEIRFVISHLTFLRKTRNGV